MSIGGNLPVDRVPQVQFLDDCRRLEVEVFIDQPADSLIRDHTSTEGVYVQRYRSGHSDGIGHLELAAAGQPRSHHILGCIAQIIGG